MVLLDVLGAIRSSRPSWRLSVILTGEGPLRPEIERLGVEVIVLPFPNQIASLGDSGLGSWRGQRALALAWRVPSAASAAFVYSLKLRRILKDLAPDVLHTNGMKAHLLGAWSACRALPVVWHMHDYLGSRALMARLLRISIRPKLTIAAISESVANDIKSTLGPKTAVRMIYNAVDLKRFHPGPGDGRALDHAAGLPDPPPGTIRIGLVATFARWKGHDVFLNAIAQIGASFPCRFYIVGGPIYQSAGSQFTLSELKDRAKSLGIDQHVGFTGHQNDPAEALRGLDVIVHASTRPEPFGRVIVEAMACGRALIAVQSGGAAELFVDGREALATAPGDFKALADRISQLMHNNDLRTRLGQAGRQTAEARFGCERLAEEWPEFYESLHVNSSHVVDCDIVSQKRTSSSPVTNH